MLDLESALAQHFGFGAFHPGQRAVIEDVLAERPTVAVMPTGAGKSLCYQLPALLLPGVAVIVSPLIALMKDQVDGLRARGVAADILNSSQSPAEQRDAIDRLRLGETRLVYVAPERFRHAAFVRALETVPLSLFAVDEAHCISRWGHDFRPDYTRLGEVRERLRPPRLLACTATATPEVREDILDALGIPDASVHVAGFLRPNLFLEVRTVSGERDREARLLEFLKRPALTSGAVILYASTRKRVEQYATICREALGREGVVAYHGGMGDAERTAAQDRFMSRQARVAVATNAFGMGVDRADVRAVVHLDLPRTIEGYYQEAGRAGRDGAPAHCLLLSHSADTRVHEFLIDRNALSADAVQAVWDTLRDADEGLSMGEIEAAVNRVDAQIDTEQVLRRLQRADAVLYENGILHATPGAPDDVAALDLDFDAIARHRDHEHAKLREMRRFVSEPACRHRFVLTYFGETYGGDCPGCDRCAPDRAVAGGLVRRETPDADEALVIRKALAGVARAEGRFGLRKVAGMLAGAQSADILRTSLPQLSTYGVLRVVGVAGCGELLSLLVDEGLCRIEAGQYPLITITERGWRVMQGHECAGFKPPPHLVPRTGGVAAAPPRAATSRSSATPNGASSPAKTTPSHGPADPELVEALRAFRRAEADRQGIAAFVVLHNRTLEALAALAPSTRDEFLAVPGLGPGKWDAIGPAVLATIAEARGD